MVLKEFLEAIQDKGGKLTDTILFIDNHACGTDFEIICDDESIYIKFKETFEWKI